MKLGVTVTLLALLSAACTVKVEVDAPQAKTPPISASDGVGAEYQNGGGGGGVMPLDPAPVTPPASTQDPPGGTVMNPPLSDSKGPNAVPAPDVACAADADCADPVQSCVDERTAVIDANGRCADGTCVYDRSSVQCPTQSTCNPAIAGGCAPM